MLSATSASHLCLLLSALWASFSLQLCPSGLGLLPCVFVEGAGGYCLIAKWSVRGGGKALAITVSVPNLDLVMDYNAKLYVLLLLFLPIFYVLFCL